MRPRMIGAILIGVGFLTLGQMLPAAGQMPILDCDATHPVTTCDSTGTCTTTQVRNTIGWYLSTYTSPSGTGPSLNVRGTCREGAGNVAISERFTNVVLDGRDLPGDMRGLAVIEASDPYTSAIAIRGRNVTIRAVDIRALEVGLQVHRGGTAVIDGARISFAPSTGIRVDQFAFAKIINSAIFHNAGDGIYVGEGGVARIGFLSTTDTTAQPNYIAGNSGSGINVQGIGEARIVGNRIEGNGGDGIQVSMGSQARISSNIIDNNAGNGITASQNSGANLGADEGTGMLDRPNETTSPNAGAAVTCRMGGYVDGRLGTLAGHKAPKFSQACINSLK